MPKREASNELDNTVIFINNIQNRLNRCDEYWEKGEFFEALRALKSPIRMLRSAFYEDEDIKTLEELTKIINSIEKLTTNSASKEENASLSYEMKTRKSYEIYEQVETSIWDLLGNAGFYTKPGRNNLKLDDLDKTKMEEE